MQGRECRGRRIEDVLLGLWLRAFPGGQSAFQIDHAYLGSREELAHRATESRGRVRCEPQSDRTLKVHIAAECQGDGLAVTSPIRVQWRMGRE